MVQLPLSCDLNEQAKTLHIPFELDSCPSHSISGYTLPICINHDLEGFWNRRFTGQMTFQSRNQQHQSTEGITSCVPKNINLFMPLQITRNCCPSSVSISMSLHSLTVAVRHGCTVHWTNQLNTLSLLTKMNGRTSPAPHKPWTIAATIEERCFCIITCGVWWLFPYLWHLKTNWLTYVYKWQCLAAITCLYTYICIYLKTTKCQWSIGILNREQSNNLDFIDNEVDIGILTVVK